MADLTRIKKIKCTENHEHEIDAIAWDGYETSDLATIDGRDLLDGGDITTMEEVTYDDLVSLRNGGYLIPGKQYRITDYNCVDDTDVNQLMLHPFDIIVTADTTDSLNEKARACLSKWDTYFSENGANLDAWQIWYCLDGDRNRFDWADPNIHGRGVIYRMIDEWGNDCPYDFKNIQFERWCYESGDALPTIDCVDSDTQTRKKFYTFSYIDENGEIHDYSVKGNNGSIAPFQTDLGVGVYKNIIAPRYIYTGLGGNPINHPRQSLNNIVFVNTMGGVVCENTFGVDCYNNTLGSITNKNIFGEGCYNNTLGHLCVDNAFGMGCFNNVLGGACVSNTFGNGCSRNTFASECSYNTFETNCHSNAFGIKCQDNTFGNACANIKLGENSDGNSFGNFCQYNNFQISSDYDRPLDGCCYNHFDDGCSYIKIVCNKPNISDYLKNININRGVCGSRGAEKVILIHNINSQNEINVYNDKGHVYVDYGDINVTYEQLKTLVANGQLTPGRDYRIIDYVTTTSQEDTKSAGHQFDIIVTALDENTLSEEAKAIQHDGDSYFANSNLSAWKIWYSLDNDTDKFAWAGNSRVDKTYTKLEYADCEYAFTIPYQMDDEEGKNQFDEWVVVKGKMINDTEDLGTYDQTRVNEVFSHWDYMENADGEFILRMYPRLIDGDYQGGNYQDNGLSVSEYYEYNGVTTIDGIDYDLWVKSDIINAEYSLVYLLTDRIVTTKAENPYFYTHSETVKIDPKGVIYRMIDEFNNDCPYDFKNIMFTRMLKNNQALTEEESEANSYSDCYTFTWIDNNNILRDASLKGFEGSSSVVEGEIKGKMYSNIIKSYNVYTHDGGDDVIATQTLNNIVFLSSYKFNIGIYYGCYNNIFANGCYNNSFNNACNNNTFGNGCYGNTFGNGCHTNTFGYGCYGNTLGKFCHHNTFGDGCFNNTFGNDCCDNTFGTNCYHNTLGFSCCDNTFGSTCYTNTFDTVCSDNTFGNDCHDNGFGNDCHDNTFGNSCNENTFGSACVNNTFSVGCYTNTFGNDCSDNTFGNDCFDNTFGDGCYGNTFGKNCSNNNFIGYCYRNAFGDYCYMNTLNDSNRYNTFGTYCYRNTFGNNCYYNDCGINFNNNTFGYMCYNNIFGSTCRNITFGDSCYNNTFKSNFSNIKFGSTCYNNSLGNSCSYIYFGASAQNNNIGNNCSYIIFGTSTTSLISYYRNIIVDSYNRYIKLQCTSTTSTSKYYQNVRICLGVNNAASYKTITDANVGQAYETTVTSTNSISKKI